MKKTIVMFSMLYSIGALGQYDTLRPAFGISDIITLHNEVKLECEVPIFLNPGLYIVELKPLPLDVMPGSIEVAPLESCAILSARQHFQHVAKPHQNQSFNLMVQDLLHYSKDHVEKRNAGKAHSDESTNDDDVQEALLELVDVLIKNRLGINGSAKHTSGQEGSSPAQSYTTLHVALACRNAITDTLYFSYHLPLVSSPASAHVEDALPHLDHEGMGSMPVDDGPYSLRIDPDGLHEEAAPEYMRRTHANGAVHGKVVHAKTGEGLPFVHVTLMGERRHCLGVAHTDHMGRYSFSGVVPGVCMLKLNCSGYRTAKAKGVMVPSNGVASMDFSMKVKDPFAWVAIVELAAMLFFIDQGSLQSLLAIKALGELADVASKSE